MVPPFCLVLIFSGLIKKGPYSAIISVGYSAAACRCLLLLNLFGQYFGKRVCLAITGITAGGTTRVAGSLLYGADCGYSMNFENAIKSVFCDYPSLDDISTVTFLSNIYIGKKTGHFSTKVLHLQFIFILN